MAMSKLAQKAVAAITRLQPDPSEGYLAQRKAEDAAGKLTVASPRCRIDNLSVTPTTATRFPAACSPRLTWTFRCAPASR